MKQILGVATSKKTHFLHAASQKFCQCYVGLQHWAQMAFPWSTYTLEADEGDEEEELTPSLAGEVDGTADSEGANSATTLPWPAGSPQLFSTEEAVNLYVGLLYTKKTIAEPEGWRLWWLMAGFCIVKTSRGWAIEKPLSRARSQYSLACARGAVGEAACAC